MSGRKQHDERLQPDDFSEASEHFISALRLQNSSESSPIWSTLRSAIIRMNATDVGLMDALNSRDVQGVASALSRAAAVV